MNLASSSRLSAAAALPTDRPICNARVPQAIGQSLDWLIPAEAEVLGARVADRPAAFPLAELEQRASASVVDSDLLSRRLRPPERHHQHLMLGALREYLARSNTAAAQASSADQPNIRAMVARIEVRNSHLALWLMHPGQEGADETTAPPAPIEENSPLLIRWTKPPAKRFKEILLPASTAQSRARPMKAERRAALIKSIARGRA